MLHEIDTVRGDLYDDVYASTGLCLPAPKFRIPEREHSARQAYAILRDELMLDGNSRMNLASFCQPWKEPEAELLMSRALDENMVDRDQFPRASEIESRCVAMIADLWHAPHASNAVGCSTTGSSEAAMLSGLAMKWRWRQRRAREGKPSDRPNLVCGPVHLCWHKFARYFDVELREIPSDGDRVGLSPHDLVGRCDENTIGVVPTLGLSCTLRYEPVRAIANALDDLQAKTDLDIPIHVDGASGGFIAPFIHPDITWDFALPRVKSINASGHKFGLTPLGCGWCVWRDSADLPRELVFHVDDLGGSMPTFALTFSRPAGQVVVQYYNFLRLGRDGYRRIHEVSAETAQYLASEIAKIGPFDVLYDGVGGLPGACWTLKQNGRAAPFTLYDLADRMRVKGWQVPAYPLPTHRPLIVQRVLVRHGMSRDLAALLVRDVKGAVQHFERHPATAPLEQYEASGYHH